MGDFLKKAYNEQQQNEKVKTIPKHKGTTMTNKTKDTIKVWLLAIVLSLLFYVSFWVFVRIVTYSLEPF